MQASLENWSLLIALMVPGLLQMAVNDAEPDASVYCIAVSTICIQGSNWTRGLRTILLYTVAHTLTHEDLGYITAGIIITSVCICEYTTPINFILNKLVGQVIRVLLSSGGGRGKLPPPQTSQLFPQTAKLLPPKFVRDMFLS